MPDHDATGRESLARRDPVVTEPELVEDDVGIAVDVGHARRSDSRDPDVFDRAVVVQASERGIDQIGPLHAPTARSVCDDRPGSSERRNATPPRLDVDNDGQPFSVGNIAEQTERRDEYRQPESPEQRQIVGSLAFENGDLVPRGVGERRIGVLGSVPARQPDVASMCEHRDRQSCVDESANLLFDGLIVDAAEEAALRLDHHVCETRAHSVELRGLPASGEHVCRRWNALVDLVAELRTDAVGHAHRTHSG